MNWRNRLLLWAAAAGLILAIGVGAANQGCEPRQTIINRETDGSIQVEDHPGGAQINFNVRVITVSGHQFAIATSYDGVAICEVTEASRVGNQ